MEIDPKTGKYKLSHRVLIPKPEGYVERPTRRERGERRPRPERKPRGDHRQDGAFRDEEREPRDFNDSLDKMGY